MLLRCCCCRCCCHLQDGTQCSTRILREAHNFTGLLMDGGHSRPEINLQKEMMYSHNIASLFSKHSVPSPSFDHLTVDLDQNTFWVALEVLRAGYRPRSLAVEINRNLAWGDSYATVDMLEEMWVSRGELPTLHKIRLSWPRRYKLSSLIKSFCDWLPTSCWVTRITAGAVNAYGRLAVASLATCSTGTLQVQPVPLTQACRTTSGCGYMH